MRITTKMGYASIANNISQLQEQRYYNLMRESTGKHIQSIADAPTNLMDVKKIIAQKDMKENYISQNEYAVSEMRFAEDQATAIADSMQEIRDLSIQSLNVAYDGNVAAIGTYIKGIMNDMVRNANQDFNGKYIFAGTKTTADNIQNDNPGLNNLPFEIIEGTPTENNPSGLEIIYKGDTQSRTINKDGHTTEIINLNGEELFGANGNEWFTPIINIYNTLLYNENGEIRETLDTMTTENKQQIANWQSTVALNIDKVNKNIAMLSSKRDRIEKVDIQLTEEVLRLDEVKSLKEEAEMPKVLTQLAQEAQALEYSLQAGAQINQFSLFKFL